MFARTIIAVLCLASPLVAAAAPEWAAEADRRYAEKSYVQAEEQYRRLLAEHPGDAATPEWTLRLADCLWRPDRSDNRAKAEEMLATLIKAGGDPLLLARAHVAMADLLAQQDLNRAVAELDAAIAYFGGPTDMPLEEARSELIALLYRKAEFLSRYQWRGDQRFLGTYKTLLKVAKDKQHKEDALFGIGEAYRHQGNHKEALEYYLQLLEMEETDRALYFAAASHQNLGQLVPAVKYYRRLVDKYTKATSRWYEDSEGRLRDIVQPRLTARVHNGYNPGATVELFLDWRNLSEAKISIHRIDLAGALPQTLSSDHAPDRLLSVADDDTLRKFKRSTVRSWTEKLEDKGDYQPHDRRIFVDALPAGVYLIEADAGKATGYALLFVSKLALVVRQDRGGFVAFTCDGVTSRPMPGVIVYYLVATDRRNREPNQPRWQWTRYKTTTGDDGLARASVAADGRIAVLWVAVSGDETAVAAHTHYGGARGAWQRKVYGVTDRPVYRPGETLHWSLLLREVEEAETRTLADHTTTVRIRNPRGEDIWKKQMQSDAFGQLSGDYELSVLGDEPPLGEYHIQLVEGEREYHAVTFRIEEYKLPEFNVTVEPQKGKFLPGDALVAHVTAEYYFGGPVANAQLVYVIKESPMYVMFRPHRKYDWYYEDLYARERGWWGGGRTIAQETVQTDADGRARIEWKSNKDANTNLRYDIEVRVTDASRREIVGSGQVKVGTQLYTLHLDPKRHVYRPLDRAEVTLLVKDVNDQPVAATGTIFLYKLRWRDDRQQNEPIRLFEEDWQVGEKGELDYSITLTDVGYYKLVFASTPERGPAVQAETTLWCTRKGEKHLDVRPGQLQIIPEKDTFSVGETARLLVVGFHADTHVLFTREAGEIVEARVVTLSGRSALIEIPVTRAMVPNVFFSATAVRDNQVYADTKQVIVPPESQFITVELSPSAEDYPPGGEGAYDVKVTDASGAPVEARLMLSVADEAVYAIAPEYAPDVRRFFYGEKRHQQTSMTGSHQRLQFLSAQAFEERRREEERDKARRLLEADEKRQAGVAGARYDEDRLYMFERRLRGVAPAPAAAEQEVALQAMERVPETAAAGTHFLGRVVAGMPARAEKAVSAGEPPLSAAAVRADFRSTIFWSPMIETDSAGMARVPLKYAESLTQWRATARAFTADTRVGEVFVKTRTRKNVMIRLQAPRFFVERDLVTLSANVHNEFAEPLRVKVSITVAAATDNEEAPLQLSGESVRWVEVGPRAQQRVDWTARATRPAPVNITVTAESGRESDAMMRTYPVMVHGAPKMLTAAGSFKNKWTFSFKLPEERSPEVSRLKIIVTPSLAASLFDCLSYLADYPYGCVEQTMSRFLPSAIVARTLERQGLSRDDVDPQLSEKLRDGLARLAGFQHNDGGWGWWTADDSNPWMSTYVCFGLQLLGDADYNIDRNMLDRGLNYLRNELLKQGDNPDMAAFMLYVLGKAGRSDAEMDKLSAALYERREKLSPSTLALLGLYYHSKKDLEKSGVIGRNLVGFAKVEKSNDTAQFGRTGVVVRWSEAAVEATALSLYALAEIAPEEPVVRQAVRWLVYNRRGNRWNSTRDTALAVLALNAYLEKSGEQKSAGTLTLSRAGRVMDTWRIEAETRVRPRELTLAEGEWLAAGDNRYELAWDGGGEVYAFAYLTFFTKEEDITAAGNEVFVSRKYYRVVPKETLLQGVYETKVELEPGESVRSGERLEVELSIDCKNNYEYLVFEDYKPAGCEPIAQVSGPAWGAVYTQMELRDEKVAFFVSRMNQGRHEIRYQLRAEVPGAFHVLPHQAHAMYVPEIRANSAEGRLEIAP